MAGRDSIHTVTGASNDGDWKEVTGTDFAEKRAIDTNVLSGNISGSFTPSGLQNGGRITVVSINDSTWTALPAAALTDRNQINVQNFTGVEIKISHDPLAVGYVGMRIPDQTERFYQITDAIVIYAKSSVGTVNIEVEEIA